MDASRFIGLAFLAVSLAVLSNQMATNSTETETPEEFQCPLMDFPKIVNGTLLHNIKRTVECVNGREMAGCCITRFYCNFNTSHIDLTLYGKPGYRMTCSDVCCPQNYILPIPLPNLNKTTDLYNRGQWNKTDNVVVDDSESSDNSNDSDSEENE